MSVYGTANRLAREIKKSDEYTAYQEIREKILADENKKNMLQDYIEEQMKIQSKRMAGEELTDEEKERIESLNNLIEMNADIKKYLQREYQMSVMINDLQNILFGKLKIGVIDQENKQKQETDEVEEE